MTPRTDRAPRPAGPFTLVAATALGVVLVYHIRHVPDYRQVFSDYVQDYLSAQAAFAGVSIYAPLDAAVVAPGMGVPDHPAGLVNNHPPPYVAAFAPLAAGGYGPAVGLLELVILASYIGIAVLTGRELGFGTAGTLLLAAATLAHPGVTMGLWTANPSAVIGLLTVAGWAALRNRADRTAGGTLGLAAALKMYPALAVVGLAAARRWAAVGGFVVAAAGAWAVAAAAFGPGDCVRYVTERMGANGREYVGHAFNLSASGAAHRLLGPPCPMSPWLGRLAVAPAWADRVALGGSALIAVAVVGRCLTLPPAGRTADRLFALLIPGMLLLSPLTWLPSVPVAVPVLAVLAAEARRHGRTARLAAVVGCVLLVCVDDRRVAEFVLNDLGRDEVPWGWNLVMLAPTWGLLGVLLLGLVGWRELAD